jgi:hypothetical protein
MLFTKPRAQAERSYTRHRFDSGGGDIVEFWIQGSTAIGPNALEPRSKYDIGSVGFYKYPAGGKPTKTLMKGFGAPQGSAISK